MDIFEVKRLGFVCLPTDVTGPAEIQAIAIHFPNIVTISTNVRFPPGVEQLGKESYEFALVHLKDVLDLLRPADAFDCVGICCTSFAFTVGMDRINTQILEAMPGAKALNMAASVFKAIKTLNLKKVNVLTPYCEDLNLTLKQHLED